MTGYSREELRNIGLVDIHPKESLPYVLQQFERVAKREITLAKDLPVKRRDGTVFYVDVNAIPTILGGKTYLVGVFRDITERKRMEEKLRKAERMAVIGETAAMVGHDLRNPLQVMVNRLFLADKAAKNLSYPYSDVAEKLDLEGLFLDLEHQIEYMNKIVSDLQDYAKPIVPEMVEMNLRSLVEATFSTIEVPRNVIVSTELLKDVRLIVDAAMIRRVFSNIIMNALQAMPGGGKLEIRSLMSDDHVSVDFQDTGVGIPKENMDKIFIPLFTTKAKGTGLGLPVCKRLVEAHDGRIIVDSRVGEGTTVKIVLPIKPIGKGA
jgi:signal transduction histidine kinase